jgi:hypothetical protein
MAVLSYVTCVYTVRSHAVMNLEKLIIPSLNRSQRDQMMGQHVFLFANQRDCVKSLSFARGACPREN